MDLRADRDYTAQKKAELGIRVDPAGVSRVEESDFIVNIFAGNNRRGAWDVPRSIRMVNIFGGSELDFTDARFTAETTYVTVFCLFGGAHFRVPDGMRSISKTLCIFGGVDNRSGSRADPNAPLLVVEGLCLFGGVDIRVKKTPKQRLHEFADQLRTMFSAEPPRA